MEQAPLLSRKQLGGLFLGGIAAATTASAFAQSTPQTPISTPVPVTGNDAIEILKEDHKRIKHHLERLISDVDSRHDTLMSLSLLFTVHNATEENYIYPAIAKVAMLPESAETLFHQQDGAKEVVWELHAIARAEGFHSHRFTETAQNLLAAALAHVHLEESRDFPRLRAALGQQRLMELTGDVRMFRQRFA